MQQPRLSRTTRRPSSAPPFVNMRADMSIGVCWARAACVAVVQLTY